MTGREACTDRSEGVDHCLNGGWAAWTRQGHGSDLTGGVAAQGDDPDIGAAVRAERERGQHGHSESGGYQALGRYVVVGRVGDPGLKAGLCRQVEQV